MIMKRRWRVQKKENKPVLIDFTGWACVNCRRMEENVWPNEQVNELIGINSLLYRYMWMRKDRYRPPSKLIFTTKTGSQKKIITVGDKWATFQSENFDAVAQPQYAIISPDEKVLTKTKGYTPNAKEFATVVRVWYRCL